MVHVKHGMQTALNCPRCAVSILMKLVKYNTLPRITVISVERTKPQPRSMTFHVHTCYESCVCGVIQPVS